MMRSHLLSGFAEGVKASAAYYGNAAGSEEEINHLAGELRAIDFQDIFSAEETPLTLATVPATANPRTDRLRGFCALHVVLGSAGRARTYDRSINSRLLYH